MKRWAALLAISLSLSPASADTPGKDVHEGFDLMQDGTRLMLRGLMDRLEPDLRALMEQVQPAMKDLAAIIGDLSAYHAPEILPNGDILLCRKVPLPGPRLPPSTTPQPGAQIDL